MSEGTDRPSEGWYADPKNPGIARYWDGDQWTERVRPLSDATSPTRPAPPTFGSFGGGGAGGGGAAGPPPNNYLAPAILSTIFCCLPFGIVSIVKAAQVNSLWNSGQADAAYRASADAKKWAIVSACVSAGLFLLYILLFVAIGLGEGLDSTTFE